LPRATATGRLATVARVLRDSIVPRLQRYFEQAPAKFVAAYLCGSVARGQERADSDVDVAIVLTAGKPRSLGQLDEVAAVEDDLTRLLGRSVDVVIMNGAPPDLAHRILVDRILLFESDRQRRIEFELQARNEYFDIAPMLQRYRRTVLERL
jgi:predicted nucleotidyltransferase